MSVLKEIVAQKRLDVADRMARTPLERLLERVEPTTRSLRRALLRRGAAFILEAKRASPSEGVIRPSFDPLEIARAYAPVADAVSILTDTTFFGGTLEYLSEFRTLLGQPILCKDFVVDPYQVVEARTLGADAILLMLSVLDDSTALSCLQTARSLRMDCLVEVHDEAELSRALALDAPIIGINNRNLATLEIDLEVTERLAPRIPKDRVLVAESGVHGTADLARLGPHVDGFLVGTALMRADDLADAARALVTGRVKVCGLTRPEDARHVEHAGASFLGLIFAPGSPRRLDLACAEEIASSARLPCVGVFRDQEPAEVAAIAQALQLSAVQLHGKESASYIATLRSLLPSGCQVWSALAVSVEGSGPVLRDAPEADRLLFDAQTGAQHGGTGVAFDWLRVSRHPRLAGALLAGGIGPEEAFAARRVGAYALDVSSRLELRPGEKDPARIDALFAALRGPSRKESDS